MKNDKKVIDKFSNYLLAKIYYDKADLLLAKENFIKALDSEEARENPYEKLKILGFLIRISSERQEVEESEKFISMSEDLLKKISREQVRPSAEFYYHSGAICNYRGDFVGAEEAYLESYRRAKEENEPELLSKCLLAISMNYFFRKNFDSAIQYLDQLNQLLKIIDKAYLLGSMYVYAGKVNLHMGNYEVALDNFEKATMVLQQKKCWNLFGYTLMWKGTVYKRLGEFNKALMMYNLARESSDNAVFKRLHKLLQVEIQDVTDSNIDIYLDRTNRKVVERDIGTIDFKHRFVLLEILFLLAKNPGIYFDKEQLAKAIWKDEYNPLIHDKLIYTSVSRLRKLIEPKTGKGEKSKYVIRGKDGYTFNPSAKIRFHVEHRASVGRPLANVDLATPV